MPISDRPALKSVEFTVPSPFRSEATFADVVVPNWPRIKTMSVVLTTPSSFDVARQNIEPASIGGDDGVADRNRHPIDRGDRLGQRDRVACARTRNRDRSIVGDGDAGDGRRRRGYSVAAALSVMLRLLMASQGRSVVRPAGSSRSPSAAVVRRRRARGAPLYRNRADGSADLVDGDGELHLSCV